MISVVVGTFGSKEWEQMGSATAASLSDQTLQPTSVHHVHAATLAESRNTGASLSEGEWLLFLDADDSLDKNFTYYMNNFLLKVSDKNLLVRPAITLSSSPELGVHVLPERNLRETNFMIIGTLVRRDHFLKVGGFRELPLLEDWDLWIRCRIGGSRYAACGQAVYHINTNENSRNQPDYKTQVRVANLIRSTYAYEIF